MSETFGGRRASFRIGPTTQALNSRTAPTTGAAHLATLTLRVHAPQDPSAARAATRLPHHKPPCHGSRDPGMTESDSVVHRRYSPRNLAASPACLAVWALRPEPENRPVMPRDPCAKRWVIPRVDSASELERCRSPRPRLRSSDARTRRIHADGYNDVAARSVGDVPAKVRKGECKLPLLRWSDTLAPPVSKPAPHRPRCAAAVPVGPSAGGSTTACVRRDDLSRRLVGMTRWDDQPPEAISARSGPDPIA